jgi:hypothetical protein
MRLLIICLSLLMLASCKEDIDRQKTEIEQAKLPFKVDAPWGATKETREYNGVTAFTISKDDDYGVEIIASPAKTQDITAIKNEQIKSVVESPYFRRILLNEPNGFVFEMLVDSSKHYDFRLIKLKDSTQYIFQTDLTMVFSEGETRLMYESVK